VVNLRAHNSHLNAPTWPHGKGPSLRPNMLRNARHEVERCCGRGSYTFHPSHHRRVIEESPIMVMKLYGHPFSQPSRAVLALCEAAKIPHTYVTVDLMKMEQKAENFCKVNKNQLVPAIEEDDGFTLSESHAILTYLADKHACNDWYSTDLKIRASINQYLHFHHLMVRAITAPYYRREFIGPKVAAQMPNAPAFAPASKEEMDAQKKAVAKCLGKVEDQYFQSGPYLCTSNHPSVADLVFCEEVQQHAAIESVDFSQLPKIQALFSLMDADDRIKGTRAQRQALHAWISS
jgi:glutathione S-transferase